MRVSSTSSPALKDEWIQRKHPALNIQHPASNACIPEIFLCLCQLRDLLAALVTMDAYQWLFFNGAHCKRHTAQILEVKADPNYPKS
jgi:hypothetical protein